ADLAIQKSDSPDPVLAGSTLVYTLVITNIQANKAPDVVITDTLPTGVTFVSGTWVRSAGISQTVTSGVCSAAAQVVRCPGGSATLSLEAATTATATITTTVSGSVAGGTVLTNTGYVTNTNASTPNDPVIDTNPANNVATATTTVIRQPDLAIFKTDGQTT